MSEVVSKGMVALRRSKGKAERISVGGETFYFRKLTIDLEDEIEAIVQRNQDKSLKQPTEPAKDAGEEAWAEFTKEFLAYKRAAERAFRKLTAELMKFVLLDECDKPLFSEDDPVYENLDNVYAEKFFRGYQKFRQGAQAEAAEAEARFPK